MTDAELKQAIVSLLETNTVCTLATRGPDAPHAASLMYAWHDFNLYWLSDPEVRHSRDLGRDARCAMTIAGQFGDFREICGLQMSGHGGLAAEFGAEEHGRELLTRRFPFLKVVASSKLTRALTAAAIYRFRPRRITLIDNTRGFGFKETLQVPDPSSDG